jgi:hypothetical protein
MCVNVPASTIYNCFGMLRYHRYKPGDVLAAPPVIAPHQPRLDWQMWFAALGSYSHDPWIIHLADQLLEVCYVLHSAAWTFAIPHSLSVSE